MEMCRSCGQLTGIKAYDEALWDIYHRIDDGRSQREALVYTGEEFEESWDDLHEENYAMIAMERDMHDRGLCTECGRPDLTNVDPRNIMTEEEARDMYDMWAEQAAERRAGC